ncbi:NAD(P)-binding protein [Thelephora ganbajun]|uniref:NAD(P)-binding protein n=1 Tax=Thelephora ganbajun TaxID=370292 RepID=A0ACB6ZDW4_THEGA|nr:NAD(P)-binding protein [Thelephora ganbajun]
MPWFTIKTRTGDCSAFSISHSPFIYSDKLKRMPAIAPGSKVLVTGANGFLATHVVKAFLDRQYSVRGTVRSQEKGDHLHKLFSSHGNKFETVVVKDITQEGAFDEVIKDVDAVAHTASPFHFEADDPNELFIPAINGTKGILQSARKSTTIKRIVILSSTAAISNAPNPGKVYTEEDWNDVAIKAVEEHGKAASGDEKYSASKMRAEKAAWDWYNTNKASVEWDLTTINPPFIFGPTLHEVDKLENLNTSSQLWYEQVVKNTSNSPDLGKSVGSYVDVRDVALANVLAVEKEAAGGERILVPAAPFTWQDMINASRKVGPSIGLNNLPQGYTGYDASEVTYETVFSGEKLKGILGFKPIPLEDTVRDSLLDFKARGWL